MLLYNQALLSTPISCILFSHYTSVAIFVKDGKASGVKLSDGTTIQANKAVVSNADPFVTKKLLKKAIESGKTTDEFNKYMDQMTNVKADDGGIPNLKSFIHIHAGIDATGLPPLPSADFP